MGSGWGGRVTEADDDRQRPCRNNSSGRLSCRKSPVVVAPNPVTAYSGDRSSRRSMWRQNVQLSGLGLNSEIHVHCLVLKPPMGFGLRSRFGLLGFG